MSDQRPRTNIFGALRLLFAVAVIFNHAWVVNFLHRETDPISHLVPDLGTGSTAVVGFFAVSGLLISQSARRNSARRFLTLRIARIYPGYLVAIFVVGLVLEPVLYATVHRSLTGAPWVGAHSMLSYSLMNVGVLQLQSTIPGVVAHGMVSDVDGPLWTIKWEMACYLIGLACVLAGRRLHHNGAVALAWSICACMVAIRIALLHGALDPAQASVALPVCVDLFAFFLCFGIGLQRHEWLANAWIRTAVLALLAGLVALHAWTAAGEFVFPLGVVLVGSTPVGGPLASIGRRWDLSYGIYLYAWPVQQILAARRVLSGELYLLFPLSVLLTLPLAAMSWWCVESRALRLAHRTRPAAAIGSSAIPASLRDVALEGAATSL